MRLICPNCGAQYAIDQRVIPDAGRDVQCSACGHTWFQNHPDQISQSAADVRTAAPESVASNMSPRADSAAPEPQAPETPSVQAAAATKASASEPEPDAGQLPPEPEPADDAPLAEPAEPTRESVRSPVTDDAMSVLREEAAREQAARRAESESLEIQPDLGVVDAPRPRSQRPATVKEILSPRPSDPATPPEPSAPDSEREGRIAPRRDILPDVEEINSTLEPEGENGDSRRRGRSTKRSLQRKRGSRIGMALSFVGFGSLALLYGQAGRVSEAVPSTAQPLAEYVQAVNDGRVWLDETLRGSVSKSGDKTE